MADAQPDFRGRLKKKKPRIIWLSGRETIWNMDAEMFISSWEVETEQCLFGWEVRVWVNLFDKLSIKANDTFSMIWENSENIQPYKKSRIEAKILLLHN